MDDEEQGVDADAVPATPAPPISQPQQQQRDAADASKRAPVAVVVASGLTRAVTFQFQLLNASVVRLLLGECHLREQVFALRRYFLMDGGDMYDIYLTDLFSRLRDGRSVVNSHELTASLGAAVKCSTCANDRFADSLRVSSTLSQGDLPGPWTLGALDHLRLHTEVPWPLSLVVTTESLAVYQRLFNHMLRLRRVSHELREVWILLKQRTVRERAKDPRMHALSLFRAEVVHFIEAMQGYTLTSVLHVCWSELQAKLTASPETTVDTLRAAHAAYLDKALHYCLLQENAASLATLIGTICEHALTFCRQVQSGITGERLLEAFPEIMRIKTSFRQYVSFLFKVLQRLAAKGYQSHLEDLLIRLDFNSKMASNTAD
jgi:hypothetical protein